MKREQEMMMARRELIKNAGIAGVGVLATSVLASTVAKAAGAKATPPQTEGPFYPVRDQVDKDADMTRVRGRSGVAKGERIQLRGKVVDAETGRPLAGALVEFWQACASGKYHHPADTNTAPLDPDFQYWAQVRSDGQGMFSLLTIKPGAYPADTNWIRPPHIHVKVHAAGYPSLTTQLYFKGDPLNAKDQILKNVPENLRNLVIVDFSQTGASGGHVGEWTIYVKKFSGSAVMHELQATPEVDD